MPKSESLFFRLLLSSIFLAVATPVEAQDDEIRWVDSYREAIKEAKRTQKPIFLEFRCEP